MKLKLYSDNSLATRRRCSKPIYNNSIPSPCSRSVRGRFLARNRAAASTYTLVQEAMNAIKTKPGALPMCFKEQLEHNSTRVTSIYHGHMISYDQPGDWCAHCGEGNLTGTDAVATQATLPEWRAHIDKQRKEE